MEFSIDTNNVLLEQQDQVESGEYNVTECSFIFSSEYEGLTKKAVFTGEDGTAYLETIVDNKCPIPSEILEVSQVVEIGVYAYDVDNEELVLRYSPEPTQFYIHQGSYKEAQNSTPPTPSEVEQLQAQITTNANNIEELTGDVVDINQDIADIKAEQITQNENIQTNTDNISTINGQIITINADIDNLERTKADKSEIPTKTSDLINDSDFVSDSEYVHTDNNFTDEDEAQITTNKNDIATLQSTKADKSEIPTKTSDLTNDSGYITKNVDDLANYYKKSETYNKTEVNTLLDDKVDKVQGKGLSTNDFTDSYKNQIEANQTAITNIKDGTTIDSFGDVETALEDKEDVANKVTELTDQSTDTQYPSAKCVYDSQEEQDTEIEALQAENAELKQDITNMAKAMYKVDGQGSDITLPNTSENKFVEFGLEGRTEQESLSGKNLANINVISNTEVITIANDTITLANNTNPVGYTPTNKLLKNVCPLLAVGDNVYISFKTTSNSTSKNTIYLNGANITWSSGTAKTITQEMLDSYFTLYGGHDETAVISEFMVRKSTEDDTYEPYCGGIPAPNPIYKIPIKNVTGNAKVKIQNKNLFVFEDLQEKVTSFNITGEKENFTIARKSTNSYNYPLSLPSGESYTFSGKWLTTYGNGAMSVIYTDGTSAGYIMTNYSTSSANGNISLTTNASKTISHIKIELFAGGNYTIENLQIEEGSTATSYVEHQEQNYPFTFVEGQRGMQGTQLKDDGIHNSRRQIEITSENVNSLVTRITSSFNVAGVLLPKLTMGCEESYSANVALINNYYEVTESNMEKSGSFATDFNKQNLIIFDDRFTDLETAKSLLIGTIIEIEQAEPEIIPYNETQQAQYNAMKEASSYDDITIISSESDELGFNMNVVAVADANKVIDNQNSEIDTIKSRLDLLEA